MTDKKYSSRTLHLMHDLATLGFYDARRALDIVINEMNKEKGFKRHDGAHYYHHLVDVAQICITFRIKNNQDENLIIAALLHDIVEDVPGWDLERITSTFNQRVADIVGLLSKTKGVDYQNPKNMEDYLMRILEDEDASILKTADRMHNFGTLRHASFEKKVRQAKETAKFFIPFFKKARVKFSHHASFFFSAKTYIEPHLWEIQEHDDTYKELERLKRENVLLKEEISLIN